MIGKQTFVALVDEKSQTLFRIARSILRNEEDCNDALQEGILKAWASRHNVRLHFTDPGCPTQNAYVESFNGRMRDEFLRGCPYTAKKVMQTA